MPGLKALTGEMTLKSDEWNHLDEAAAILTAIGRMDSQRTAKATLAVDSMRAACDEIARPAKRTQQEEPSTRGAARAERIKQE